MPYIKLSRCDVLTIIDHIRRGTSREALTFAYDVSLGMICHIARGRYHRIEGVEYPVTPTKPTAEELAAESDRHILAVAKTKEEWV